MNKLIIEELAEAAVLLNKVMSDEVLISKINQASQVIVRAIQKGGKLIICGNGGSMCDAMHFASELTGRYREDRNPIPAIAISDPAYLSCVSNDYSYSLSFTRQIEALINANDVLIAISTSGYSQNVHNAAKSAYAKKAIVIALTGKDGGTLKSMCDIELRVPHEKYADRIQEVHIKIIHILVLLIEKGLGY